MKTTTLLTIGVLIALSAMGTAQIVHDYPSGGDLGYHDWTQPLGRPVALNEMTVVMPISARHAFPDRPAAGLQVLRHLHGIVLVDFVPVPGNAADTHGIWPRPYRLDDSSVVMPGTGPDGVYKSSDDVLVLVTGLDEPANATVLTIPIGTYGPSRDEDLVVAGPRRVFWLQGHRDGWMGDGDQNLVAVDDIGGPGQNVQIYPILSIDGNSRFIRPYIDMGSYWIMPATGRDGLISTPDDALALIDFDAAGQLSVQVMPLGRDNYMPHDQVWPRRIGDDGIAYLSLGDVNNDEDDYLVEMTFISTAPNIGGFPLDQDVPFGDPLNSPALDMEPDTSLVLPKPGPDDLMGTDDDEILVVDSKGKELLQPMVALAAPGGDTVQPFAVADDVTIVPHHGTSILSHLDAGLIVIRRLGDGTLATQQLVLFDTIDHVVRMSDSSVMVFTSSGGSHHFAGLGSPQITQISISTNGWDGVSEPVRISPVAVVTTAMSTPDGSWVVNDTLRVHKMPGHWTYGEATPNLSGYSLEIGVGSTAPTIGGPAFQVTLDGAPPIEPALLFVSLARDDLLVMPDARILVSGELLLAQHPYGTYADGATAIALFPPADPLLAGIAGHMQWLVWDSASPRGFQLSDALTISF